LKKIIIILVILVLSCNKEKTIDGIVKNFSESDFKRELNSGLSINAKNYFNYSLLHLSIAFDRMSRLT